MNIWGRYKRKAPEIIDTADKSNSASFLVSEYQLAFGSDWVIWAGRRKDEPK